MRYCLTIEYCGTGFLGWQAQANALTVQGVIEAAAKAINGVAVTVCGAGRTDAGVHAYGQVAHIDLVRAWDPFVLCKALNAHMRPHLISILSAQLVDDRFHARFSACRRHYLYRILNRPSAGALEYGKVWWVPRRLNVEMMREAAQALVGLHDFTTFRASACQAKSPLKTLDVLEINRIGDHIDIYTRARSFLQHQVRSMVGSLKQVGEGKWPVAALGEALAACDRSACGAVAPPFGLYLVRVDYDIGHKS